MNDDLFVENLRKMPKAFVDCLKAASKYPDLEQSSGFFIGYIVAMEDYRVIDHELATYWIALIAQFYESIGLTQHIQKIMEELNDG
jgi:hypothetical protein